MRKEFSAWCEKTLSLKNQLFLTGDLGFMALENVRASMGDRFINVGVAEQNLIGIAAGLSSEGFVPLCYSIAPFCVFRPNEQIRLDVCLHQLNVKIVGNGGGYGYGIMGASHHAIEDYGVLSTFQSMKCFIPFANCEVEIICEAMYDYHGPSYLRLGNSVLTEAHKIRFNLEKSKKQFRKLSNGTELVIIFVGAVGVNALDAIIELENSGPKLSCAVYALTQIPVMKLTDEFKADINQAKKLLIIEEHVARGGAGENLALKILMENLNPKIVHLHAAGYPTKSYGQQKFHQKQSGLDVENIKFKITELINGK